MRISKSIAALVAIICEEGPLSPGHTAAALAIANMTDVHLKNSRTAALEEGSLEALVRIAGHAEEEGRVHAVRCLANLSEPYDNRELIGVTEGAFETLLLAIGSNNDTLATTAAFTLAKLTESVAANIVALADTFNVMEKLTECVVRGSRRARSNAAVCLCHLTARRHGISVKVARTAGARILVVSLSISSDLSYCDEMCFNQISIIVTLKSTLLYYDVL